MPLVHERSFRVRHYECDAYGHVNHVNYLRFMQEAAMDASTAAGYGLVQYQAMQRQWWIRETDISYLHPLVYGDTVTVKTWVLDFRRVRSRRAYELRLANSGEIVAEAFSDWVYIDSESRRPTAIPGEVIGAFFPEGYTGDNPARVPFPDPPPAPPGAFRVQRRVEWHDLDAAGHVNNAMYLAYLEECGVRMAAAFGWPMTRMANAGFGLVARRCRIEYRQPATLDDDLTLSTWFSDPHHTSAVRHYTITRESDNALLVRAHTRWVWVDLATARPIRIPAEFLDDFSPNFAGTNGRFDL
ncbi:MAG: acyl-CoA thioesterase [Anaerolineae bacterium]|nr:acyl-CoA thioesterase [Anaerolineae bacterium]